MAENSKNITQHTAQYNKLAEAIKAMNEGTKDQTRSMQELYVIIEAIKKGWLDLATSGQKFEDVIAAIGKKKHGAQYLLELKTALELNTEQAQELEKVFYETQHQQKQFFKDELAYRKSGILGASELLDLLEERRDVSEEISDLQDDYLDALSGGMQLEEKTLSIIKQKLKQDQLRNFETKLTNKTFTEMVDSMLTLGELSRDIEPIIDSNPAIELENHLGKIKKAFRPLSKQTFEIDGNTTNFDEAVQNAKRSLDEKLAQTVIDIDARSIAIPTGISMGIKAEFETDPDVAAEFFKTLKERVQSQFGTDFDPFGYATTWKTEEYMKNIGAMASDAIDALSGVQVKTKILPDGSKQQVLDVVEATKQQQEAAEALMHVLASMHMDEYAAYIIQESQLRAIAARTQEQIETDKQRLDILSKYRGAIMSLGEAGQQLGFSLQRGFNTLPDWMQQMMGTSKITATITESWQKAVDGIVLDLQDGVDFSKALSKNFGVMRANILGMLNPWIIVLGVVAGLTALMIGLENSVKGISKDLGISRAQAAQLYKESMGIVGAWDNQLTTQEDVLDVMKKHQEKYGTLLDISKESNQEAIKFAANLGKQYGMAAGEVYAIGQQFKQIGASQEVSDNLTAWMAKASDISGIPFSTFTKDMTEASELISTHFDGMPKQAARAIVSVRRLGMSMKQVGSAMDKALDVSGFLTNMSELNAMTMGATDMSTFFEMRFSGASIEEQGAEIAKQFDAMHASGQANEFTMRKFAETVGMSVEELQKSRKIRQELKGLGEAELSTLNKHLDSLSDADLANTKAAKMAASRLDTQEKFNVAWEKLKGELMTGFLPIIEAFGDGLSALLPIISLIGKALGGVAAVVNLILAPFKALFKLLGGIGDAVTTGSLEPIRTSFSEIFSGIKDDLMGVFGSFGSIAAAAAGAMVLKFTGGFKMLGNLYKGFFGLFKSSGLKTAADTAKGMTSTFKDKFTGAFSTIKDKFVSIFKGGKEAATKATESITEGIGDKVSSTKEMVDKAKEMAPSVESKGPDVSKKVTEGLDSASDSSKKVDKKAGQNVKEFLVNLAEGLKAMGSGKVVLGALALIPSSLGLVAMIPGYLGAKLLSNIDGERLKTGLTGMADGLKAMASGKAVIGALALVVASLGFTAMIPGAIGMFLLGAAAPMAATGLAVLGPALAAFGAIMMSGAGLVGLIAFTGAAIGLGYALKQIAPTIAAFAPIISSFGDIVSAAFSGIANVVTAITSGFVNMFNAITSVSPSQLIGTATGLTALSAAMAAFGGGSLISGIASGIGSLFGGDPVKKLMNLASVATPMQVLAESLDGITSSLKDLNEIDISDSVDKLTTGLESLADIDPAKLQLSAMVSQANLQMNRNMQSFDNNLVPMQRDNTRVDRPMPLPQRQLPTESINVEIPPIQMPRDNTRVELLKGVQQLSSDIQNQPKQQDLTGMLSNIDSGIRGMNPTQLLMKGVKSLFDKDEESNVQTPPIIQEPATIQTVPTPTLSAIERANIKASVPPPQPAVTTTTTPEEPDRRKRATEEHQMKMLMKEMIQAINSSSDRPVKVYIGDTELRTFSKKMKALNNY